MHLSLLKHGELTQYYPFNKNGKAATWARAIASQYKQSHHQKTTVIPKIKVELTLNLYGHKTTDYNNIDMTLDV
jgi:hypothetical protein